MRHQTLVLAAILTIGWSAPKVYAQPAQQPQTTEIGMTLPKLTVIQPITAPQITPLEQLPIIDSQTSAATSTASPAPTSAAGCVTGYVSGDYYLDKIISYESTGNSCATNPGGCFGLLQACPGAPLRDACGGDPACQIEWFQANKTGGRSWAQVWDHEVQYGWW